MSDLLREMLQHVKERKKRVARLTAKQIDPWIRRYRSILREGREDNPALPPPVSPRRGRPKQTKAQNLLDRLERHERSALAFLHDFRVPFTNNQAEQDLRMMKVQQKISGTFRTTDGARIFARIRGYVSTVRKHENDDLEKASLFDLWLLDIAISRALEDPKKIAAIRSQLRIGQAVCYFDEKQNREISGRIVEIRRTRASIRNDHDQQIWDIPFHMMNLEGTADDFYFTGTSQKMDRDSIRVGDSVGYISREHRRMYGVVVKRNRKTATVRLSNGEQWRVSYSLLFPVIEATVIAVRADKKEGALITRAQMREAGEEKGDGFGKQTT